MKQMPPWIHRFDDGRGVRKVFLGGEEVWMVVFADQKRGIVDRFRQPLTVRRRDGQLITERLRGRVEVVWQTSS
jgi:hypothetical protein